MPESDGGRATETAAAAHRLPVHPAPDHQLAGGTPAGHRAAARPARRGAAGDDRMRKRLTGTNTPPAGPLGDWAGGCVLLCWETNSDCREI